MAAKNNIASLFGDFAITKAVKPKPKAAGKSPREKFVMTVMDQIGLAQDVQNSGATMKVEGKRGKNKWFKLDGTDWRIFPTYGGEELDLGGGNSITVGKDFNRVIPALEKLKEVALGGHLDAELDRASEKISVRLGHKNK